METNTCEKPARSHSRLSLPGCNQSKSGHGNKEPKPKILRYQEFSLDLNAISLQEVPPTISTISTIHVWQEQQAQGFNNLKENSEVS